MCAGSEALGEPAAWSVMNWWVERARQERLRGALGDTQGSLTSVNVLSDKGHSGIQIRRSVAR